MNFDSLAVRVIRIDDLITSLSPYDPDYVARRLMPRRARAWATFRAKWSADVSSAQAWEFVHIINTRATP